MSWFVLWCVGLVCVVLNRVVFELLRCICFVVLLCCVALL